MTDFVEDFFQQEKQSLDYGLFTLEPTIRFTKNLTLDTSTITDKNQIILKPSILVKVFGGLFLFGLLSVFVFYLTKVNQTKVLIILIIIIAALIYGIYYFLRGNDMNFLIEINDKEITIDKNTFLWGNIFETLIMQKPFSKSSQTFLVIIDNEGKASKFNIDNFGMSDERISAFIEHYRQKNKRTTGGFGQVGRT